MPDSKDNNTPLTLRIRRRGSVFNLRSPDSGWIGENFDTSQCFSFRCPAGISLPRKLRQRITLGASEDSGDFSYPQCKRVVIVFFNLWLNLASFAISIFRWSSMNVCMCWCLLWNCGDAGWLNVSGFCFWVIMCSCLRFQFLLSNCRWCGLG